MKKLFVPIVLCSILLFFSCAHYTGQEGLKKIQPEQPATTVTKYSIIQNGPIVPVDKDKLITSLQTENAKLTDENKKLTVATDSQATRLAFDEKRIAAMTTDMVTLQAQLSTYTAKETKAKEAVQAIAKAQASLPAFETITYPNVYRNGDIITSSPMDRLDVLLLPLGEIDYSERQIAEIAGSIEDLKTQVTIVTGSKKNVYQLAKTINHSAVITEMGAVISDYALDGNPDQWGVKLKLDDTRTIRVVPAEMPEYTVFETFLSGGDWKGTVASIKGKRLDTTHKMLENDVPSEAAILGASLYEPASSDWNTMSPVEYRRMDYAWPLADTILNAGYMDTYRQTHFSEATDAGDTVIEKTLKERIDYLFAKHILPLSSSIITLGPESVVTDGYARMGVLASYLVP
ncbi:MAG: hypothetical protein WCQ66_07335 [Sphaerochaetaceae bacterium]|jgi:hypothetical protein